MKKPGPKKTNYDVSIIKKEILNYYKNNSVKGLVSYAEIYRHCQNQYLNNKFPYNLSYEFFKKKERLGKKLVDEFNSIKTKQVRISKGDTIDYVDIEDVIEKYGGDKKEALLLHLNPLKRQFEELLVNNQKMEEKMMSLEKEITKLKEEIKDTNDKREIMQETLLEMFTYSRDNNELINLMTLGQSRSKVVNKALKNIFSSPLSFVEELKKVTKGYKEEREYKVVPIKKEVVEPEFDL